MLRARAFPPPIRGIAPGIASSRKTTPNAVYLPDHPALRSPPVMAHEHLRRRVAGQVADQCGVAIGFLETDRDVRALDPVANS